jgi:tetratricopeptide (TPR) repeat protein
LAAGNNAAALATAKTAMGLDKMNGNFLAGIYFSRNNNTDSAVYYYQQAVKLYNCTICYNNIGHCYFVNNQIDSARRYFNLALAVDSTNAFPIYNLATLDAINGDFGKAANGFAQAIDNSPSFTQAFVTHLDLYFNKTYAIKEGPLYQAFSRKSFLFDMQYLGYTSLLYCFMRDSVSLHSKKPFEFIFPRLFEFKDFAVFSWYHHACYKALLKDKAGALQSLEKSLKLGFGTYFMLVSDNDLSFIRSSKEFKALLLKYFPAESKANR